MQKILTILAWIISVVFHPLGMATIGCCLYVACYLYPLFGDVFDLYLIKPVFYYYYLLPALVCLLYTVLFRKKVQFNSTYYRVVVLYIVAILYFINDLRGVALPVFSLYISSCTVIIFVAAFITIMWNISLHTIGVGGLVGLLCTLRHEPMIGDMALVLFPAMIVLAGLVGSARLYLKAHTPLQIYAGYALGFLGFIFQDWI